MSGAARPERAAAEGRTGAAAEGPAFGNAAAEGPAFTVESLVPTAGEMTGLGTRIAGLLTAGDLVVLSGPLGAGKTTLTQGIGAGLSVRGPVTSPTFVIARVHPSLAGGPDLVHADAYRLGSRAEVDDLDLDADLATSVTVVEWGEGLVEGLAGSYLAVGIEALPPADPFHDSAGQDSSGPDSTGPDGTDEPRTVRVSGWGERWREAADQAMQALAGAS
jgi:tRNA threonylcarbamoyladenosine biosynthesis protein TsaE